MPAASHPQAQFVPIPPDLDLRTLVENTANFDFVTRLPKDMLKDHSPQSLENLILLHVIVGGKPLVIEGWETRLDPSLYNPTWLRENLGTKAETVRDIPNATNIPMSIGHYLKSLDQLTKQFTKDNYRDPKRQRLYLKDIDTPEEWHEHLQSFLPECLFYLNECIETRTGGNGAILEPNEYGQMRYGRGVALAGDLMSSLPEEMRAQNMMCYIGHEGTYTPAHREMCGSLGHNIMVETSHDQRGEKAGSSIWFMTETKEREVVSEYFLSMLGHDIEVEKHFAQINAWKKAPFNVYVVEQKVGDLILIPPLAPHQVWNRGTRTMKAAWNRTTVDTLELAIHEALPRARLVCRDEQYKNKAIIYYTLQKYFRLMQRDTIEPKMWRFGRIKEVMKDFKRLFALYSEVLISESFSPALPKEKEVEFLPYDSNVTCSYCRCNIFNRFLTCKSCIEYGQAGAEDTYDICMECYAMGRSCGCISGLKWVEQWQWTELIDNYEDWRNLVIDFDDYFDDETSPQPFNLARERYGKKPVAQIVQEQLTIRPWHDIRAVREPTPIPSDAETDLDDEGRPKKKAKRKSKKVNKKTHTCHVCMHHEQNWKLAFCTNCSKAYCYGVLFRAFDLMPQAIMENEKWQCPECLGICSCGKCRRGKKQKPYAPKGTLLGHDTRAVADFRSVESLVDFSRANLQWLRGEGDENPQKSSRMERLKEKAQERKSKEFAEGASLGYMAMDDDADISAIDPSLLQNGTSYMMGHGYDEQDADAHGTNGYEPLPHNLHHVLEFLGGDGYQHNPQDVPPESDLSRQAAPVAQMLAADISYPDPSNFGRDRMMGIGYYQQADNIDKILYDSPGGSEKSASQPAAFDPSLLDPSLAVADTESAAAAKRKRADLEDLENSEDNMDPLNATLFKRQRHHEEKDNDFQPSKSKKARLDNRPVRKSAAKIQSFAADDEEEAILGDVDPENGITIAQPNLNHNDLELAEQAMMRLFAASADEKPKPKPKKDKIEEPKRRSTRGQLSSMDNTPVASAEKPGRKSAWLARKEAAEAKADKSVNEQPKKKDGRGRPRRSVQSKTTETLSESEEDDEDGRISLSTELPKKGGRGRPRKSTVPTQISSESEAEDNGVGGAMISDNDSLFNEPTVSKAPGKRGLKWRTSDVDSNVEVPQMDESDDAVEEPTLIHSAKSHPVPPGKRLSLREKMALKGKGFKIVPSKQRPSIEPQSAAPSSRNTPSATNLMQEKSPVVSIPSPAISTTRPVTSSVQSTAHKSSPIVAAEIASKGTTPLLRSRPETPATTTKPMAANGPTIIRRSELVDPTITGQEDPRFNNFQPVNKPKPSIEKAAEPVIKKGPTVVRLMESDSESDPDDEPMSSASDESSSGESIPAVKSTTKGSHGNTFVRGRGSLSVRGSRGRGRGRGRPRGS